MNKKVIGIFKDELGGKIMTEFVALRLKTHPYLMDDDNSDKKSKGTKKCAIKQRLKLNDYKKCLFDKKPILKLQQRFKSEPHNVYTEGINKIALSRLETFDNITSYPYETNAFKACKSEMLSKYK